MRYYNTIDEIRQEQPTVITLGKFDGIHRGHQKLLKMVQQAASEQGLERVMFTFGVSPQTAMGEKDYQVLITNEEKRALAEYFGMDALVECPFTKALRNMTALEFVQQVLQERLKAKCIVVGEDFHFGKGRSGSAQFLMQCGPRFGFRTIVVEKEKDGEREISSTYIREELTKGNIEKVNELLGYPFFISGTVVNGMHMGTGLGFPTINQVPAAEKLLPPKGVYASNVHIGDRTYTGITNIGTKPTVGGKVLGVETHLMNFAGDIYGKNVRVELLRFQRPEQKFSSVEELKEQVQRDIRSREEML